MVYLSNPAQIRKHIKMGKLLCGAERNVLNKILRKLKTLKTSDLGGRVDTFFCIQAINFYFI